MDLIAYFAAKKKTIVPETDEFRKILPNKLGLLTNKESKNKYRWVSSAVPLPFHASRI
jgi:hypothetical protein